MDRFYLSPESWTPDELQLSGEEGHHAVRVMRKKVGDQVEVFDGQGRWSRGVVSEVEKAQMTVSIQEEGFSERQSPQVHLAVSIPKGKTMDLVVQKAVELGVAGIQPLVTRNSVVKVSAKEAVEKSLKWQRVALEACKQCGQNFLPEVQPVRTLTSYLGQPQEGSALIASLATGALPVRESLEALPEGCRALSFLVGPEGDFTAEEVAEALEGGFAPVSLGEIVLRVETACLFLASATRYRFG